jgi:AcrR family transcriptional regulator
MARQNPNSDRLVASKGDGSLLKEQLLDAAQSLMVVGNDPKVRLVAKIAKVTTPSVYLHFKSVADMYAALAERDNAKIISLHRETLTTDPSLLPLLCGIRIEPEVDTLSIEEAQFRSNLYRRIGAITGVTAPRAMWDALTPRSETDTVATSSQNISLNLGLLACSLALVDEVAAGQLLPERALQIGVLFCSARTVQL